VEAVRWKVRPARYCVVDRVRFNININININIRQHTTNWPFVQNLGINNSL
jgi:hypothetical protein